MGVPRILHYPGSKWSLAEWIVSHMPEHSTYLEPFFGSGAVLFNKEPVKVETINDIDGDVVNLFRVIRERPNELAQAIRWTPYSRKEYIDSHIDACETIRDWCLCRTVHLDLSHSKIKVPSIYEITKG